VDDTSDQDRFAEVFLPHLVDAFRLARWLAGSRIDAEDIVQEASLRAFKAIRGFGGGDSRAWVLTIVRNTSYSWLAKNRPQAVILKDDLGERARDRIDRSAGAEQETPETALIAKIEAEQIIRMRDRVNRMISEETGQSIEKIVKDTQRNFWMNAEEAVEYGIVSRIIMNTFEV
jgi:RNA polymerase sigma-70 factor (ECF subfamily)